MEADGPYSMSAAARNALKRKKQHEHSLEQTSGQISMLEQQIYSIESANINQETLVAMKNAGKAMKEIHGKMTMEDVDVTMCVTPPLPQPSLHVPPEHQPQLTSLLFYSAGNNSANNTNSPKKSATPSPPCPSPSPSTKTNWKPISQRWSRRISMRKC